MAIRPEMAISTRGLPFAKPEKRVTAKRRDKATEWHQIVVIRAQVLGRDGSCRLRGVKAMGLCAGPTEWAHWPRKRSQTRGEAAARRHATTGSLALCRKHHQAQEAGKIVIEACSGKQCDGPLVFRAVGWPLATSHITYFEGI